MPKKRGYVPKTKGCYECSQRRIHCDRTEPECLKCSSKGIKCSGLHVRYRFSSGVSSRGKWVGKTAGDIFAHHANGEDNSQLSLSRNLQNPPRPLRWRPQLGVNRCPGEKSPSNTPQKAKANRVSKRISQPNKTGPSADIGSTSLETQHGGDTTTHGNSLISRGDLDLWDVQQPRVPLFPDPFPHNIPSWKRFLLLHFSNQIANEMVAIDGPHNGWRHLILPVALTDDTLMDAVLAASAFHLSLNAPDDSNNVHEVVLCRKQPLSNQDPRQLYMQAIHSLKSRGFREDDNSQHAIFLTILVLLTSAMVTGDSDFTILCQLLKSAVSVIGGAKALGTGELASFITRQIHKLLTYAAPLLSEENGFGIMSSNQRLEALDCLNHCIRQQPDHHYAVSLVADLINQAQDIYLSQFHPESCVQSSDQPPGSIFMVQKFIDTVQAFPCNSPGEQVLVWASFIAASASVLDEHKAFFETYLFRHYRRSGFQNLIKGLGHLRHIWARDPSERWTGLLPRARILIM